MFGALSARSRQAFRVSPKNHVRTFANRLFRRENIPVCALIVGLSAFCFQVSVIIV